MSNSKETAAKFQRTSFWEFLVGREAGVETKVEIPIIQRDYAQGRQGEEFLRKKFLKDLKDALAGESELKLYFVYGSEKDGKKQRVKVLQPLDGQQRLTTLWLLHWYIALRAAVELRGESDEAMKEGKTREAKKLLKGATKLLKDAYGVLGNFTYETRISSREFCENLCTPKNFESFRGGRIVDFIENQRWFYSAWKQDPTIQSMLRMLNGTENGDGIENLLNGVSYGEYLNSLKSGVSNDKGVPKIKLTDGRVNKLLKPLDEQQHDIARCLLYWYITLQAYTEARRYTGSNPTGELSLLLKDACEGLKNFTRGVSISSKEFCENLFEPKNFGSFSGEKIVNFIESQKWFCPKWKQDPAVMSLLNILEGTKGSDGIEGVFEMVDHKKYWEILKNDSPIVFHYLPLNRIGLSDDLYVKMNARGKPLTPFENFKADLIGYIRERKEEESEEGNEGNDPGENENSREDGNKQKKWKDLLDPKKDGIPIKLDNTWIDIFWKHHSEDNRVDEIYLAFLNRFFWNEFFFPTNDIGDYVPKGLENLGDKDDTEYIEEYNFLIKDDNSKIKSKLFDNLQTILDNYCKYKERYGEYKESGGNPLPEFFLEEEWKKRKEVPFPDVFFPKWIQGDFKFIPVYKNSNGKDIVPRISRVDRVIFFALCKYFKEETVEEDADFAALKRWMRVVCNLVSGRDTYGTHYIRDYSGVRNGIEDINKLESHNVLKSLSTRAIENADYAFKYQLNEETIKAIQILDEKDKSGKIFRLYNGEYNEYKNKTWEKIIIAAEESAFFEGSIRFLYQNDKGGKEWDRIQDNSIRDSFIDKWDKAKEYFDKKVAGEGTQNAVDARLKMLLKVLISKFRGEDFSKVLLWGESGAKKKAALGNKDKMVLKEPTNWTWMSYLTNQSLYSPVHEFLTINDKVSDTIKGLEGQPCPGKEDEVKYALYLLTKTELLDRVIKVFGESGLRHENGHLVVREFGSNEFTRGDQHVILCTKKYDFLLQTNVTREQFYKNYKIDLKIPNTNLHFECANICFSYEGYNFILYRNDNLIYLQPREPEGWEGVTIKGTSDEYHFEKTIDEVAAGWENDEGEAKEEKIKKFLKALKDLAKKATENGDLPKPPSNS